MQNPNVQVELNIAPDQMLEPPAGLSNEPPSAQVYEPSAQV